MKTIYKFVSDAPNQLSAYTGDQAGKSLPVQHGPWQSAGEIGPGEKIPYQLDRKQIEDSIDELGYQMWRMTKAS